MVVFHEMGCAAYSPLLEFCFARAMFGCDIRIRLVPLVLYVSQGVGHRHDVVEVRFWCLPCVANFAARNLAPTT